VLLLLLLLCDVAVAACSVAVTACVQLQLLATLLLFLAHRQLPRCTAAAPVPQVLLLLLLLLAGGRKPVISRSYMAIAGWPCVMFGMLGSCLFTAAATAAVWGVISEAQQRMSTWLLC
jgi:hypothetical protein